jgi:hypothetical protein
LAIAAWPGAGIVTPMALEDPAPSRIPAVVAGKETNEAGVE